MNNILQEIILNKEEEVGLLKRSLIFYQKPRVSGKSFKKSLLSSGLSVIAEIKRRSPAKGQLSTIEDPVGLAFDYVRGGATAISVLTDEHYFDGSIIDLGRVATAFRETEITILRKDFIIDPIQIVEAVLFGADAVLLIASVLGDNLRSFLDYTKRMNIDALVEVHDEKEIDLALNAGAEIIGVNNRNLTTFSVDINRSLQLIRQMPPKIIRVSESGVATADTALKLYQSGFNAVLVGGALVCAKDPGKLIKTMRGQYE